MKTAYQEAYDILTAAIGAIIDGKEPSTENMENCFSISLAHWERLKQTIQQDDFDSDADEILFFKTIKPKFTGLVEYYNQRYQAFLFIPDNGPAAALYFWKMELRRIQRFFELHADFIEYYDSASTELDQLYFLRIYSDLSNFAQARVYDIDEATSSSHDWIVSKLFGMRMYRTDVEAEIYKLEQIRPHKSK